MSFKFIAILPIVLSCASVKDVAEQVHTVAASCHYLQSYADEAHDALLAKDYRLASILVSNAYYSSLEDKDTPCLAESKKLMEVVHSIIIKQLKDSSVQQ